MRLLLQFGRFIVSGIASTATTLLLLMLLVEILEVNAVLASVYGYIAGGIVNYILNYRFTFKSEKSHRVAIPRHLLVVSLGLLLNTVVMYLGVERFGWHYVATQFAAIFLVLFISFLLSRNWTFSNRLPSEIHSDD